jgi:hypothetical protein
MSAILWGHGFFINHYYKIPKKRIKSSNIAMSFPFLFYFWSLTVVGEEASMLTIIHGVENLGFGFSSMPLLNDLDAFCIKPMAGRIDVLQCNRWGNVEFLKHYKCN